MLINAMYLNEIKFYKQNRQGFEYLSVLNFFEIIIPFFLFHKSDTPQILGLYDKLVGSKPFLWVY